MLKIAILALENCIHSTVTGAFDIFSIASLQAGKQGDNDESFCSVDIVQPGKQPVHAFNGLAIQGTIGIRASVQYDIVVIPALFGNLEPMLDDRDLIDWVRKQHSKGACISSVCAGAFLVAEAGLLKGRRATTHWALADDFRRRFPEIILKPEKMLVDEGDIISAGGVTAYLDLCLYLIDRFGSHALASSISRTLLIDRTRQMQTPYSSYTFSQNHGDEAIEKAQSHLQKQYNNPIKVSSLAVVAGLEERTFNRRFKKATGETPTEYMRGFRIEAARKLLETTSASVDTITREVGYEDTSSFRRLFKHATGLTPSDYRKRFSIFSAGAYI